jgi:hypothetical protein
MKNSVSKAIRFCKSPAGVVLGISLLFLICSLFFTHRTRPYNSDDVTWQLIVHTWTPSNGHDVTLGSSDNFVSKIPYFYLFEKVFSSSRKLILLEATVFAVIGFCLFYISALYFMRKAKIAWTFSNLVPILWLASLGFSFSQLLLNPIWRGVELGISFFLFMIFSKYCQNELNPLKNIRNKTVSLLLAVFLGLMIYSDPYFLYFALGPLGIFTCVLYVLRRITGRQVIFLLGLVAASLVFAKAVDMLSHYMNIRMATTYPIEFISFEKLWGNIALSIQALLVIVGANFFGQKVVGIATLGALLNAGVLGYIAIRHWKEVAVARTHKVWGSDRLWAFFFVCLSLFAIVIYTISTVSVDLSTYRYFAIVVYAITLYLCLTLNSIKSQIKFIVVGVLLLSSIVNLYLSWRGVQGYQQPGARGNTANQLNYALIGQMKQRGLTKGYANYWQAGINTYLSKNEVLFLPVLCPNGETVPFHWLIDESRFKFTAKQSFYILDPDLPDPYPCSVEQITQQFGQPIETLTIANKKVLIFNYDIYTRFRPGA